MPKLQVNRKLERFLTVQKSIKVAIGGRGSGKSIGFGDMLTMKMDTEMADIYCLREHQNDISDSVHRVFSDSIEKRLMLTGWAIQENKIIAPNGAKTVYKGANRNPDAMQSAQGYRYSWFEEAHRASKASLDKLLPTIIRNPGAECWFSANPQSSEDPFSQRFIIPYQSELDTHGIYEDDLHLIVIVNWRDNPWWNEEQERLRSWDYKNRSRSEYDWIWEGKFNDQVDRAIIQPEWFDAAIDAHLKLGFKPKGAIIAAHDPSDLGEDPKGFAVRHGSVILDCQEFDGMDVNDGCDWAIDLALEHDADWFVWDADGMGVSLKRQIDQSLRGKKIQYEPYCGSHSVDNPRDIYQKIDGEAMQKSKSNDDTFFNKRSQYHWYMRDRFYKTYLAVEKGEYHNPDEMISLSSSIKNLTKLRAEACRIPRKPNGSGMIQIMSKDEMRRLLKLKSPNMFDSLVMTGITPEPVQKWQPRPKRKHCRA